MRAVKPIELIEFFGSQAAAARSLGRAQSTVAEWVKLDCVPDGAQYQVELATGGKLKADAPALRLPTKEPTHA